MNKVIQLPLSSERTTTARLSVHDCDFILELVNTREWIQFIGNRNVNSREQAVEYIQKILANPNIVYWVVRLKEGNSPIAVVTFIKRDYLSYHDLGFAFLPNYFGKGYAYEAVRAISKQIIQYYEQPHILATTVVGNASSVKLLHKLGFRFEKEIQNNQETLQVYKVSVDKFRIDEVVERFFSVFINKAGKQPDWDLLARLCLPEVMLISKTTPGHHSYGLKTFIEPRQRILTDGTLTDFEEHETSESTEIIGQLAQRKSAYSKSGFLNGKHFEQSGNKLFQLVKTGEGWKISSAIWEDDIN